MLSLSRALISVTLVCLRVLSRKIARLCFADVDAKKCKTAAIRGIPSIWGRTSNREWSEAVSESGTASKNAPR
jgi:hypothetical protein